MLSRRGKVNNFGILQSPGIIIKPPPQGQVRRVAFSFRRSRKTYLSSKNDPCDASPQSLDEFDTTEQVSIENGIAQMI